MGAEEGGGEGEEGELRGRRGGREGGGEGRKGADQCCCTEMIEVLLSIISAERTSSLLHTSHDELTKLPASEEGGERVRDQGERVRLTYAGIVNLQYFLLHEKN